MLYSKAITHLGLPLTRFSSSEFWSIYRQFNRHNGRGIFADTEKLVSLQKLLKHAAKDVPFYSERFKQVGFDPDKLNGLEDLTTLTPTTKEDIANNFPDNITAQSKCFSPWRFASTSGTLERLTVIHDFRKRDYIRAAQLFALKCAANYQPGLRYLEIPPNICTNVCGVSDTVEPRLLGYIFDNIRQGSLFDKETISNIKGMIERQVIYRQLQLPSFNQDGVTQKPAELDNYLTQIDDFQPHLVKALPTYLYLLAVHILKGGRKPRIKNCIMPMGASMSPYMKRVIEKAFAVPVREDYGCAELGSIGAQCGDSKGVGIFSQLFHVEVIKNGKPAGINEAGRVLITDLYNYAMPLIRYDIGDSAMWIKGDEESPKRLQLLGRLKDCLLNDDNQLVTSDQITDEVLSTPGVLGFQLEIDDDDADLQVTAKQGESIDLGEITRRLSSLIGNKYQIYAQEAATIMPESSGKYRYVKNLNSTLNNRI